MNSFQIKLLISLKNTALRGKETLIVKYNSHYIKLLSFLYLEGLILSFSVENDEILIILRYFFGINKLKSLRLLYKKSHITGLSHKTICKIKSDTSFIIFSTDKGFLNIQDCKKKKKGGRIVFTC